MEDCDVLYVDRPYVRPLDHSDTGSVADAIADLYVCIYGINSTKSILGPENMGIDTKMDIQSQLLMKLQGIYHTAQAAIMFLLINNFLQECKNGT